MYGTVYNLITVLQLQTLQGKVTQGYSGMLVYVTGPAKIDHVSTNNCRFLVCLLYHNFITIYITAT